MQQLPSSPSQVSITMNKLIALTISSAVLLSALEVRATSYLCVGEVSGGLAYRQGEWTSARFRAVGRFIVRPPTPQEEANYERQNLQRPAMLVQSVGEDRMPMECTTWNDVDERQCNALAGGNLVSSDSFTINPRTRRFQWYFSGGSYLRGEDGPSSSTPLVEAGKCSKF